jgi:hypothetical protein
MKPLDEQTENSRKCLNIPVLLGNKSCFVSTLLRALFFLLVCGGKMEEYEEFCEKALGRAQEASLSTGSFLPAQAESVSLIRFHGVAVLSPLVNLVIIYERFLPFKHVYT